MGSTAGMNSNGNLKPTSTLPVAPAESTPPTCPRSNGLNYMMGNETDMIDCYTESSSSLLNTTYNGTFVDCIYHCGSNAQCEEASYFSGNGSSACTLHGAPANKTYIITSLSLVSGSTSLSAGIRTISSSLSTANPIVNPTAMRALRNGLLGFGSPAPQPTTTRATSLINLTSRNTSPSLGFVTSRATSTTSFSTSSIATVSMPFVSAAATISPSLINCTDSNGQNYTATSGVVFQIQCNADYAGHDIGSPLSGLTLEDCTDMCPILSDCVIAGISWDVVTGSKTCHLKNAIGPFTSTGNDWAAIRLDALAAASSASSVASMSTRTNVISSASSAASSLTRMSLVSSANSSEVTSTSGTISVPSSAPSNIPPPLTCPEFNGTSYSNGGDFYEIDCFKEYVLGGTILSTVTAMNIEQCIGQCSSTPGCVGVTFVPRGNTCALHNTLGAGISNWNRVGARLLGKALTSVSISSSLIFYISQSFQSIAERVGILNRVQRIQLGIVRPDWAVSDYVRYHHYNIATSGCFWFHLRCLRGAICWGSSI
ncbi:hypothetical protein EJ08DRAFT_6512 [Tothia fuscella]|uniref:Apple domain-containing protein n=1 Tax=Tothia fuscella TaxID=1048955 RepID=A0A9P4U4E9_9PEZI|nr:hypothetical protein EJ08DRAFT_6512 [Tothia fuscella]